MAIVKRAHGQAFNDRDFCAIAAQRIDKIHRLDAYRDLTNFECVHSVKSRSEKLVRFSRAMLKRRSAVSQDGSGEARGDFLSGFYKPLSD